MSSSDIQLLTLTRIPNGTSMASQTPPPSMSRFVRPFQIRIAHKDAIYGFVMHLHVGMAWSGGKGGFEKACTGSLRSSREHCMPLAWNRATGRWPMQDG